MVTLIRTLKRINKSAPPTQRDRSSSKAKIEGVTTATATAQTPRIIPANHAHICYGSQLKKSSTTAADSIINLNEKRGAKAPSNNTSNNSPQKTSDTSHVRYAAAKSNNEKNIQTLSDRKRKSASDEEPLLKKVARKRSQYRYECTADGCTNQVIRGGVCWRHGAKAEVKLCSSEGCTSIAKNGGVCWRHGAKVKVKVKRCSSEGCSNQVVSGGVCRRHGAKVKVKRCSSEGCLNQAIKGGVCWRHGAKAEVKRCSSEGCSNQAIRGGVCWRHGAKAEVKVKVKRCSSEGCSNQVVSGGVCRRHGAKVKVKRCSSEGCSNQAVSGGVCRRHGAKSNQCSSEGCSNQARQARVCIKHGAKEEVDRRDYVFSADGCTNIVVSMECAEGMAQRRKLLDDEAV